MSLTELGADEKESCINLGGGYWLGLCYTFKEESTLLIYSYNASFMVD
jgi:hypothetical protein